MSDQDPTSGAQAAAAQTPAAGQAPAAEAEEFDQERARELIKKLREEIKVLKPKAQKLSEVEQAQAAAELKRAEEAGQYQQLYQEAQQRAAQLEAELSAERLRVARRDAAAAAGLTPELADRLMGDTPEEIAEDARRLQKLIGKAATAPAINPTNPGAQRGEVPTKIDPRNPPRLDSIFKPA